MEIDWGLGERLEGDFMAIRELLLIGVSIVGCVTLARGGERRVEGDAVIRGRAGESEIVIRTTDRLAGAIHSLTWGGKEFINSTDHGRQLQSACSFDCGRPGPFWAECYNPTEAGSRRDGAGEKSTSRLVSIRGEGNELETVTQMAFWLAPGEKSDGRPALNEKVLSDHLVRKHVKIGYKDWPGVIEYEVTFVVPSEERHTFAQFEALTGYMPVEFGTFWKFLPETGEIKPMEEGQGEQAYPVIAATADGKFAMGIYSAEQPSRGFEKVGYGRFRFPEARVNKWNCVFRVKDADGIAAGEHRFKMYVAVGTLEDVRSTMGAVVKDLRERKRG